MALFAVAINVAAVFVRGTRAGFPLLLHLVRAAPSRRSSYASQQPARVISVPTRFMHPAGPPDGRYRSHRKREAANSSPIFESALCWHALFTGLGKSADSAWRSSPPKCTQAEHFLINARAYFTFNESSTTRERHGERMVSESVDSRHPPRWLLAQRSHISSELIKASMRARSSCSGLSPPTPGYGEP